MSLNTLSALAHNVDPAAIVLGGMLAMLILAVALTLSRLIRSKIAHFLHKLSDGKTP
jgi:hypothetical protein